MVIFNTMWCLIQKSHWISATFIQKPHKPTVYPNIQWSNSKYKLVSTIYVCVRILPKTFSIFKFNINMWFCAMFVIYIKLGVSGLCVQTFTDNTHLWIITNFNESTYWLLQHKTPTTTYVCYLPNCVLWLKIK